MLCIRCAADGSVAVQEDDIQSQDDSIQKLNSQKLNFSDEYARSSRLR